MATTSVIRRYNNIKAVSLHLLDISKRYKLTSAKINNLVKADNKIIRVGGGPPKQRQSELPPEAINKMASNSKALNELNDQYAALSNMILNLNTQFKSTEIDTKLLSNLTKGITSLQKSIRDSLLLAHKSAYDLAVKHTGEDTKAYADKVKRFLNKKFDSQGKVKLTSGMNDGNPTITYFIEYKDIKNAKGEIEPTIIVAISYSEGHHWINPNIVNLRSIGNFRLGYQLSDDTNTAFKEIIGYINAQMIADSHLSTLNPKLVPINRKQAGLNNNAIFDEHSITVKFPKKEIRNEAQARVRADEIYKKIHAAMQAASKQRIRDRIVYVVSKKDDNWQAIYKFTTGDKFTGRTLSNEDTKKLSDIFDSNELKVIKKALNDMQ